MFIIFHSIYLTIASWPMKSGATIKLWNRQVKGLPDNNRRAKVPLFSELANVGTLFFLIFRHKMRFSAI